jgi:hypothetical protein
MRKIIIAVFACTALLAFPSGAFGQAANGSDCSYATTNGPAAGSETPTPVAVGTGTAVVYTGQEGTPGDASTVVGGCVDLNGQLAGGGGRFDGGTVEVGTGARGTYAVVDGDNNNADPSGQSDGYMGLSNYGAPGTAGGDCDDGAPGTPNSGGCFGADQPVGQWVDLPAAVPTPMCGNTSGNTWNSTSRDGCSIP